MILMLQFPDQRASEEKTENALSVTREVTSPKIAEVVALGDLEVDLEIEAVASEEGEATVVSEDVTNQDLAQDLAHPAIREESETTTKAIVEAETIDALATDVERREGQEVIQEATAMALQGDKSSEILIKKLTEVQEATVKIKVLEKLKMVTETKT